MQAEGGITVTIHVAIVEDEDSSAQVLQNYLQRFSGENDIAFHVERFSSPLLLLERYRSEWDIIFMDIDMPDINGMDAARRLRLIDQKVILIFVTNLAQYALDGYEVSAMDYILKPVQYYSFALKLSKAVWRLNDQGEASLNVFAEIGVARIKVRDIQYVEVRGHMLTYHTYDGNYYDFSSLSSREQELAGKGFARCSNRYLVNLRYVKGFKGYTLYLQDGTELKISQPRKKAFLQTFSDYSIGKAGGSF